MADVVTTNVLWNPGTAATAKQNAKEYLVHCTNLSDGTGETNVVKVDKSTLFSTAGIEPVALNIDRIEYSIQGFKAVKISWDHTTDQTAVVLGTGCGFFDFTGGLYLLRDFGYTSGLLDPQGAGDTGDILFSTIAPAANATYSITLFLNRSTT